MRITRSHISRYGNAKTMIHRDLVPLEKLSKETVDIQCAHGDIVGYPVVEVSMKVGDYPVTVQAAVSVACSGVVVAPRLSRWW